MAISKSEIVADMVKDHKGGKSPWRYDYKPDGIEGQPSYFIFSVNPKPFVRYHAGLGPFVIPACGSDDECSRPLALTQFLTEWTDRGDNIRSYTLIKGKDVAYDIVVGPERNGLGDWTKQGVWISESPEPQPEDIAKARRELTEFYKKMVQRGDNLWKSERNKGFITEVHRSAANALKLRRDWLTEIKGNLECPGCGELVSPNAIMHAGKDGCGYVFDWDRAISSGMKSAADRPAVAQEESPVTE